MAGFFDPPDSGNPFALAPAQTLGMMLSGLGSGISAASARNLPAYYGIAPGAQAFENGYNNQLTRGANYDLQMKNYNLNKSYKDLQEQALQQSIEAQKQKLGFGKQLIDAIGSGNTQPPGIRAPQKPLLGPNFSETPTAFNIGNVRPNGSSAGFQAPADFNSGVALTVNNARAYPAAFNNGQPMSIMQIGQHWAPYGDGSNDPKSWAFNVARGSGLDPNQPLDLNDPVTAAKFARGVHLAEKGANAVQPVQAYLPGASGNFTPTASPTAPQGMPQLPGPPPDTTRLQVLSSLAGYPGVGTALSGQAQREYEDAWKRYQAGVAARQFAATTANNDVTLDPVTGLPTVNPTKIAAQTAAEKAKTEAQIAGRKDSIFGGADWQNLSPDDFRKKADPQLISLADSVASGQLRLSQLSSRTGTSGAAITKNDIIAAGTKLYGDNFNPDAGDLRYEFEKNATDTSHQLGKTLYSINTVYKHLNTFQDLFMALQNGNTPAVNEVLRVWNNTTGNPKYKSAEALQHALATEIANVIKGQQLNMPEVESAVDTLSTNQSPAQMLGALEVLRHAMGDRESTILDAAEAHYVPKARADKLIGKTARAAIDHFDAVQQDFAAKQQQGFQPKMQPNGFATNPNPNAPTNMQPNVPSADAINYLKMNPKLRDKFDEKYGAGAAAKVLGK